VNRWLDGLSDWRFVAVIAGLCGLAFTVEALLFLLVIGRLDFMPLVSISCVGTLMICTVSVVGKRWRNRHGRR
jgi:hypothetical protein